MKGRSSLPPLPPGWEECYTETGEVYYQDHNRGVTQWERPAAPQQPVQPARQTSFRGPAASAPAPARAKSPPLPPGWAKGTTATGEVYFIDHNTRTSSWDDPRVQAAQPSAAPAGRPAAPPRREAVVPARAQPAQPRVSSRQLEEQRRKEQELFQQQREIEAEKARIAAQLKAEEEFRRKASEVERRRQEIEREKAQLAQMKAELARLESTPIVPQYRAQPAPAPVYAAPPPQYAAAERFTEPPRYTQGKGAVRSSQVLPPGYSRGRGVARVSEVPTRPPPDAGSPRRASSPNPVKVFRSAPIEPWVCSECETENRTNKFKCQKCSTARKDAPAPEPRPVRAESARPPKPADDRLLKPCRFGAECRRPICKFGHPELRPAGRKECRYGNECKNPRCSFAHVVMVSRSGAEGAEPQQGRPDSMDLPEGFAAEVAEKIQELYKSGVDVNQKSLELLGQLDADAAVECLRATLTDKSRNKTEVLKNLIDKQLSSSSVVAPKLAEDGDAEPAAKRAKTA